MDEPEDMTEADKEQATVSGEDFTELVNRVNDLSKLMGRALEMDTHLYEALDATATLSITLPRLFLPRGTTEDRQAVALETERLVKKIEVALKDARNCYWHDDGRPRTFTDT